MEMEIGVADASAAGADAAGAGAAGAGPVIDGELTSGAAAIVVEQAAAPPGMSSNPSIHPAQPIAKTKKPIRKFSPAWDEFEEPILHPDGFQTTKCKHCTQTYRCGSRGYGTCNMLTHSKICIHNSAIVHAPSKQKKLKFVPIELGGVSTVMPWKYDVVGIREWLGKMLVIDELPLRFVEGEGFRKLMSVCCPQFTVPSRKTMARDVREIYKTEREKLKTYFRTKSPRFSLTTDTWTSNQLMNYMVLTCHYVDEDWVLQKKILGFFTIHSHKGDDIGRGIEHCLGEWGLDKVMVVTVDNASSNDLAIAYLRKKMNILGTNVLNGRYMHMRCVAHIMNLILSDGISMLGKSVERIRLAVRFIRHSPARLSRFKACVADVGIETKCFLCHDVPTRWNSTYLMLKAACKLEEAFERYDEENPLLRVELDTKVKTVGADPVGMLCDEDWACLKRLITFLEHLYDLTCVVSGSKYITAPLFLNAICNTFTVIEKGQMNFDFEVVDMADKMKEKYQKYWGDIEKLNFLVLLAPIFYPSHKLKFVLFSIEKMFPPHLAVQVSSHTQVVLYDLFHEYLKMFSSNDASVSGSQSVNIEVAQFSGGLDDDFKRFISSQEGVQNLKWRSI